MFIKWKLLDILKIGKGTKIMNDLGERIRSVRKSEKLSMEEFGKRIGIKKSAISALESGTNNPSERTIKLICSEFRINYDWLVNGLGDMYSNVGDSLLDEIVDEYSLDDLDRQIVAEYLKLPKEQRQIFRRVIRRMFLDPQKEKTDDE